LDNDKRILKVQKEVEEEKEKHRWRGFVIVPA
jgi:hypothetical protein